MSKFNIIVRNENGYRWVLNNYKDNLPRFCSDLYGTEEQIIFSKALEKYQDIVISTIKNN
jgi:hypothetical protein